MSGAGRAERWALWLEVSLGHTFFADGRAQGLAFEPSPDTADWLRAHDAVVRSSGAQLTVALPQGVQPTGTAPLVWWLRVQDTRLMAITEGLPAAPGELLLLQPEQDAAHPQRLHAGAHAGVADTWPRTWPAVSGLLSAAAHRLPPLAVLRLPVAGPRHYQAHFAARRTVWRYWLLGDWAEAALQVVDTAQQIGFSTPQAQALDDGRMALAVQSDVGIELRQRSDARFQLRSRGAAAERVLVKRLPVAGADHFARETIHGVPTLVSDIYVHR